KGCPNLPSQPFTILTVIRDDARMSTTTRRQILLGGASVAGAAALSPLLGAGDGSAAATSRTAALHHDLPDPASSGIDHIVVLCMENRSFDHILGWLPGANGRQAGLSYPDKTGTAKPTFHLGTYQGCGH